jgi:UTP--glucose-1-phosphate uridylyltransferase
MLERLLLSNTDEGKNMKALIPAAGLGTRFLPATKAQPKEMLLVVDRPVIQYVVEEGLASAADEVVIINSRSKKAIEDHFTPDPNLVATLRARGKDVYADEVERVGNMNVSYVYQEEALGLGHAIHCAAEKTAGEPFYVLLGDVIVPDNKMLPRMQEVSDAHGGASVIAVMPVPDDQVNRFGIIAGSQVSDDVWKIDSLVEKPALEDAPSNLAVFGRYLLSARVMELLADAKPTVGGEIQLTDALDAVLKEEEMYALVIDPQDGFDTGTVASWLETNNILFQRKNG